MLSALHPELLILQASIGQAVRMPAFSARPMCCQSAKTLSRRLSIFWTKRHRASCAKATTTLPGGQHVDLRTTSLSHA